MEFPLKKIKPDFVFGDRPKKLQSELKLINDEDIFKIEQIADDSSFVIISFRGYKNTLIEGIFFRVMISMRWDFPYSPPTCILINSIFHPNVNQDGIVFRCFNKDIKEHGDWKNSDYDLTASWSPAINFIAILLSLICILSESDIQFPCNPEAAALFLEDREQYEEQFLDSCFKI